MSDAQTLSMPDISDEQLQELLTRKRKLTSNQISNMLASIKPVVRCPSGLRFIEDVDPHGVSFLWDPQLREPADRLKKIGVIHTLHGFGYYGFFKPSIAEVLSMIPEDLLDRVGAFEVIGPGDMNDLRRQWPAIEAGYHVAITILYSIA